MAGGGGATAAANIGGSDGVGSMKLGCVSTRGVLAGAAARCGDRCGDRCGERGERGERGEVSSAAVLEGLLAGCFL